MSKTLLTALTLSALAVTSPATHATPFDDACHILSVAQTADPDVSSVAVAVSPTVTSEPGSLVCTVRAHQDAQLKSMVYIKFLDICVVTPEGIVCVYEPLKFVRINSPAASMFDVCTAFVPDDGGATRYGSCSSAIA